MERSRLDKKYCALVNEMVGVRGYVQAAPKDAVALAVGLARAAIEGRWPGTPLCNPGAAVDLRSAAAQLIKAAEEVEGWSSR